MITGLEKGGNLVDFATEYYHCNVSEALQKISFFHEQKSLEKYCCKTAVSLSSKQFI